MPVAVQHDRPPERSPRWLWLVGAAVVIVFIGGGIWLAADGGDEELQSDDGAAATTFQTVDSAPGNTMMTAPTLSTASIDSGPVVTAPSTVEVTTVPDSIVPASSVPASSAPASTVPSTTYPVDEQLVASCFDGVNGDTALQAFAVARPNDSYLSQLESCVAGLDQFRLTSVSPACWERCSPRTFRVDSLAVAEYGTLPLRWGVSIPVTYTVGDGLSDSAERWEAAANPDGGYEFTLVSVDPPLTTREEAAALIGEYFAAVDRADWDAVAAFLNDDALESDARQDLQRLGITDYSPEGVAAGLAEWCRDGCKGTLPPDSALLPNGYTFEVVDGTEVIKVVWYEGYLSILGLPFRLSP